jgi:hypothetical protein
VTAAQASRPHPIADQYDWNAPVQSGCALSVAAAAAGRTHMDLLLRVRTPFGLLALQLCNPCVRTSIASPF